MSWLKKLFGKIQEEPMETVERELSPAEQAKQELDAASELHDRALAERAEFVRTHCIMVDGRFVWKTSDPTTIESWRQTDLLLEQAVDEAFRTKQLALDS